MANANGTLAKPAHFSIKSLIRPNILSLVPYRCARDDYSAGILLDANENAFGPSLGSSSPSPSSGSITASEVAAGADHASAASGMEFSEKDLERMQLNRYPDPYHVAVKERLKVLRGVEDVNQIFLGVGSDEVIDLLMRITCRPGKDSILITPPTYGMYSVTAAVNDVTISPIPLHLPSSTPDPSQHFQPDLPALLSLLDSPTGSSIKLLFLCSPGNPTSTLIPLSTVRTILSHPSFHGLLVVDEAYIDFAPDPLAQSAASLLKEGWQNLVVMQTLSKGFGLAAIRVGIALASREICHYLNATKAPYNVGTPSAAIALRALSEEGVRGTKEKVERIRKNRDWLIQQLRKLQTERPELGVGDLLGGMAGNFLLLRILRRGKDGVDAKSLVPDSARAKAVYTLLAEHKGVVVRYRGGEMGCEGCLRMTVGTEEECQELVKRFIVALEETPSQ